jgi:hypothetical protein
MRPISRLAAGAVLLALLLPAAAQKPSAYPAKGQSAATQTKDDGECLGWAQQSTGINPSAPPPAQGPSGERVRGAARGAVGGAAIGAIAGDTGKGAGVGAVAGTMAGGHRKRQKEAAAQASTADAFNRAYASCMSGRGYSVK